MRTRALTSRIAVFTAAALFGASLTIAPIVFAGNPPPSRATADASDAGTFRITPFTSPLPTPPDIQIAHIPPDPPPMREKARWVFDLRYDKGDVYLLSRQRVELAAPEETPRVMGRFAIELFEGPTLIERVRFDFPMLGAGDYSMDAGFKTPPSLEKKLVTRVGVVFPASSRGTKLELWDRATNKRWTLPWPIDEASALDAGTVDAARSKSPEK